MDEDLVTVGARIERKREKKGDSHLLLDGKSSPSGREDDSGSEPDFFKDNLAQRFLLAPETSERVKDLNAREIPLLVVIGGDAFGQMFGGDLFGFFKSDVKSINGRIISYAHIFSSLFNKINIDSNNDKFFGFFNKYRSDLFGFVMVMTPLSVIGKFFAAFKPAKFSGFVRADFDRFNDFLFLSSPVMHLFQRMIAELNDGFRFNHRDENNMRLNDGQGVFAHERENQVSQSRFFDAARTKDPAKPKKGRTALEVVEEVEEIRKAGLASWGNEVDQNIQWVRMVLNYFSNKKPEK
jgi:hypothetical protein